MQKYFLMGLISSSVLIFGFVADSRAAVPGIHIHTGLEIPVMDAPGLNAPAPGASGLGSFGNLFGDLFERMGFFAAIYPIEVGPALLGFSIDGMWHYDIDFDRTPSLLGYNHIGLAPAVTLRLPGNFFAHAAFGLNRMGYRYTGADTFKVGTLTELSAGLTLGSSGKGLTLEAVFQNRTGLRDTRYGVFRIGLLY